MKKFWMNRRGAAVCGRVVEFYFRSHWFTEEEERADSQDRGAKAGWGRTKVRLRLSEYTKRSNETDGVQQLRQQSGNHGGPCDVTNCILWRRRRLPTVKPEEWWREFYKEVLDRQEREIDAFLPLCFHLFCNSVWKAALGVPRYPQCTSQCRETSSNITFFLTRRADFGWPMLTTGACLWVKIIYNSLCVCVCWGYMTEGVMKALLMYRCMTVVLGWAATVQAWCQKLFTLVSYYTALVNRTKRGKHKARCSRSTCHKGF